MSATFFGETGPVDIPVPYLPSETVPVIVFEAVRPTRSPAGVISVTPTTSADNEGKKRAKTEKVRNGAAARPSTSRIGVKPLVFLGCREDKRF